MGQSLSLSLEAKTRLEWVIYYETRAGKNASLTARHFGIARKTLYQWLDRFEEHNLRSLEDRSTAPIKHRQKEYTPLQYERVVVLRKAHIRYGKMKLLELYRRQHPEDTALSSYLLDGKIENVQTDNGSEFHRYFEATRMKLGLDHYWSRPKTPKDNAHLERFNRTIQEEFIALGNMTADVVSFNRKLTGWLIEYNFRRPHQALGYMPPMNFHFKYHKVLPMYPSSTRA
jgi:transposase-like protein